MSIYCRTDNHATGATEIKCSGAMPAGVSKEKALSILHDHDAFLKTLPSYREHSVIPDATSADTVPADIKARSVDGDSGFPTYAVRNEVPNPVFDSNVNTTYLMVNL